MIEVILLLNHITNRDMPEHMEKPLPQTPDPMIASSSICLGGGVQDRPAADQTFEVLMTEISFCY